MTGPMAWGISFAVWASCVRSVLANCACIYQGSRLPVTLYTNFPVSDPGKYAAKAAITAYGTMCAAWDSVPGTPFESSCGASLDFSQPANNWCRIPWCYVDSSCSSGIATSVFGGSTTAYYSYATCGGAPNCYSNGPTGQYGSGTPGCPYNPNGGTYAVYKGSGCECKYQGQTLPGTMYNTTAYANFNTINLYGTTCAAWDQLPGTPYYSSCPWGAEWCHQDYNWCQAPWCYVDSACNTAISSGIFGSTIHYSYDTCLSTPNCYGNNVSAACPFDVNDNQWATAKDCNGVWAVTTTTTSSPVSDCSCIYQGLLLPESLYKEFPKTAPGQYAELPSISKYGTMCAAWDYVPGTPYNTSCPPNADYSLRENNWCRLPWCYVSPSCSSKVSTGLFLGAHTAFYSYAACGAPDCYNPGPTGNYGSGVAGCPYNPYGGTYAPWAGSGCECLYGGLELPPSLYSSSVYASLPAINIYGTTCAAWDQSPQTPFYSSCPVGAEWCHQSNNWCQLPWCYVASGCSTAKTSGVWGSSTFYSYETCGAPDCYTNSLSEANWPSLPANCPFDTQTMNWATAKDCAAWVTTTTTTPEADCSCIYQGSRLPWDTYQLYPSSDPGKYRSYSAISWYGTMCAAWDSVPGTPYEYSCPNTVDFTLKENNWCRIPWCYVGSSCPSKIATGVFQGAPTAYFSYAACGSPNCYDAGPFGPYGQGTPGCPYNMYTHLPAPYKGSNCECKYQGMTLPGSMVSTSQYNTLLAINIYGTTCGAWDQAPDTPYYSSCPLGAEWCHEAYNWCQAPWCYVESTCATAVASGVFVGAGHYSYDTCMSTPNCYQANKPANCPFDAGDAGGWSTAKYCANTWASTTTTTAAPSDCSCLYQGSILPTVLYTEYPKRAPGQYARMTSIGKYGTMCAAWDSVPGTPYYSSCPPSQDFSRASNNWCRLPWCYVSSSCSTRVATGLFQGSSTAFYSYAACGAPDCYNNPTGPGCPYDPHGQNTYSPWKSGACACAYGGNALPSSLYSSTQYNALTNIELYGTTCAAWDQSPNTPFFSSCPAGAEWCHPSYNWCQAPWCYVSSSCSTAISSGLFGSSVYYSYDTCGAPDCYTNSGSPNTWSSIAAACPFDSSDSSWTTAKDCPTGWILPPSTTTTTRNPVAPVSIFSDCECLYQGENLPESLYTQYPSNDPGKYSLANFSSMTKYGTMCAAWDSVPGTPWFSSCGPNLDFSQRQNNWCRVPWCYVSSSCASKVATGLFQGSATAFYSYTACGAPDCYNAGPWGPYGDGTPNCPYNPYGTFGTWIPGACACTHSGQTVPTAVFSNSIHNRIPGMDIYGTTCAAWDQSPQTPFYTSCPKGAEWCSRAHNWCQAPWCYVDSTCPTAVYSTVFGNNLWYSYEACGVPDCYTNSLSEDKWPNLPSNCPFDKDVSQWATAKVCGAYVTTSTTTPTPDCACIYQGSRLPYALYKDFPSSDPGKYENLTSISWYGTMCAAWDAVPGTPYASSCPNTLDFSRKENNWCRLPWCYVGANCPTKVATGVFTGSSTSYYSYAVCGSPDCYAAGPQGPYGQGTPGCPYNMATYLPAPWKGHGCDCKFQGQTLPSYMLSGSKYANLIGIEVYGTTCAAWDQSPDTPHYDSCPMGAEWCHRDFNWCQAPWCYVSDSCSSAVKSGIFPGASSYSYDTCMSAPNCYQSIMPANCPMDQGDAGGWYTAKYCANTWVTTTSTTPAPSDCSCLYQGSNLPSALITDFPKRAPGMHSKLGSIGKYGTMCAAWDSVPGTPWYSSCPPNADFSDAAYNWCRLPWCYVRPSCKTKVKSGVFQGSTTAFYSYDTCGAPDCYNNPSGPLCPYDPYGMRTYASFKSGACACKYAGQYLPSNLYSGSQYSSMPSINLYGTTCAAWDQAPDTPYFQYCPNGAEWCHPTYNWCQAPWCYVDSACDTAVSSGIWGSTVHYSYDTCGAPNCYQYSDDPSTWSSIHPACPFDSSDWGYNLIKSSDDYGWTTAKACPSWILPTETTTTQAPPAPTPAPPAPTPAPPTPRAPTPAPPPPTPAPPKPTSPPNSVFGSFRVRNIDYNKLNSASSVRADLKERLSNTVAHRYGVPESRMSMKFRSGSLIVEVVISIVAGQPVPVLNRNMFENAIVQEVLSVTNINSVKTNSAIGFTVDQVVSLEPNLPEVQETSGSSRPFGIMATAVILGLFVL